MRLVWVTDIHLNFLNRAQAEAFCAAIRRARPNAVLVGGDIAEATDLVAWLRFLELQLARPVYFVLGNHDYYRGSITQVEAAVEELVQSSRWLSWLDRSAAVELTPDTALVGHGGWADGRLGDYAHSPVQMSDFVLIADLAGIDRTTRRARLEALGDAAAAHLRRVVPAALARYRHVLVLTHVPPFRDACWHEGAISDDDFLPHFTCQATGAALLDAARAHPQATLMVLCGHTHGAGEYRPLPNLDVRTGGAEYGRPALQPLIEAGGGAPRFVEHPAARRSGWLRRSDK